MKIAYIDRNFSISSRAIIGQANSIISEYAQDRIQLTLRQLYYQFVSKNWIKNTMKEYKRLASIVNDARLAGHIDWNAIEDRTRNLNDFHYWAPETPEEALENAANGIQLNRWATQLHYIEVWVEKEALLSVFERPCNEYRVPYFACRGYNSQSEQWSAGQRLIEKINEGKEVHILHFGDHDPSGIDMTRDNLDRLTEFIGHEADASMFEVKRLALNMPQIEAYKPPPNPVKLTDSRVGGYKKLYGNESYELDALNPKIIRKLVTDNIKKFIDADLWAQTESEEQAEKDKFLAAVDKLKNGTKKGKKK